MIYIFFNTSIFFNDGNNLLNKLFRHQFFMNNIQHLFMSYDLGKNRG